MKYFLQILIFSIGTADFLLAWYALDKVLSTLQINNIIFDAGAFFIALCIGWATDAILTHLLPKKYM
jgi:hypothetical protein